MVRKLFGVVVVLAVLAAIAFVFVLRGTIGNDVLRQTLERQLSARLGEPVRIGSLGASFLPRVAVDLHDVTAGDPVRATIGEISIVTGLRGLLARRVENAAIVVTDGRVPVAMAAGLVGAAAAPPTAAASPAPSLTIASVRTLSFRHVELLAEPHALRVDLEASFEGDRLDVSRLSAASAGTTLDAEGAMTSLARRQGRFTVRANRLNLDELLAIASGLAAAVAPSASAPGTGRPDAGAAGPLDVEVAVTAPSGTVAGYAFSDLASTAHLTPGRVQLQPLAAGLFGGTFDGRLDVSSPAGTPRVALDGRLAGLDVTRALTAAQGRASLSGTVNGTVSVSSQGTSADALLRAAHGQAVLAITDGVVPGLEMVRAVILAFGKPTGAPAAGSGSAFTRLGGTFELADGTITSDNLAFASRDFDMTGTLALTVPAGGLDARVNVVLSRELTAQAGTDLRRYTLEDGRITVPAVVTGTLASPRIVVDVAAALGRALQNELKRRVGGLLDRLIKRH